jgi:gamma-glutamyltranspeptidase/glutathione hydrolase
MPLADAVDAPRLHWDGERIQIEPGYAAPALARLRSSAPLNEWAVRDIYFGGVNAVDALRGDGAGDPRRGGAVAIAS